MIWGKWGEVRLQIQSDFPKTIHRLNTQHACERFSAIPFDLKISLPFKERISDYGNNIVYLTFPIEHVTGNAKGLHKSLALNFRK